VIAGEHLSELIEEARAHVVPGVDCEVFRIPDGVGPDELASISADPTMTAARLRRLTYRAGATTDEVRRAVQALGLSIPPLWVEYLTGASLLSHGWLDANDHNEYVCIYTPKDIVDVTNAYYDWVTNDGAIMVGGGAGGSEWLQLDTVAGDDSPVVLLSSGGQGWEDTTIQADSIDEFVSLIESHRFEFAFDDGTHYEPRR
jgi:hypothetical protein